MKLKETLKNQLVMKARIPRNKDQLLYLLMKINKRYKAQRRKSLLNGAVNEDRLIWKHKNIQSLKDRKPDKNSSLPNPKRAKETDLKFDQSEIY